ncbi:hypothetical protein A6V29_04210 [Blastococcus sp. CCUG 61487]|nr:hypothetical protein A6V29_04210 [Blastococcus sp. CCUG 61487]
MTKLSSAGRGGKRAPNWPLPGDVGLEVRLRLARESEERLTAELAESEDGRTLRRLERQLAEVQSTVALLSAQEKQQKRLEGELWRDLWRTPQAVMWERLGWTRDVAQYARLKVRAELGDMNAGKEARQWSDRLGLNPMALLRLRWEVEPASAEGESRGRRTSAPRPAGRSESVVVDARDIFRHTK